MTSRILTGNLKDHILELLTGNATSVGKIESERALQLELGFAARAVGYKVQFEKTCIVNLHKFQTKPQKRYLDLLISNGQTKVALELKVPLAGRVPETLYDFISDIAFLEAVINDDVADLGYALLVTDNPQFWSGTKSDGIYAPFRSSQSLQGSIHKPTGKRNTNVFLGGSYDVRWHPIKNQNLRITGKFALVKVTAQN